MSQAWSTVSILARPFGRALRFGGRRTCHKSSCFNPRPAFWPGATLLIMAGWSGLRVFQSSPGLLAGRYETSLTRGVRWTSFNPRPAFWPGSTRVWRYWCCMAPVSILARPFGRALRHERGLLHDLVGVSILARPFGRALLDHRPRTGNANQVSILARPFGRALLGKAGRSFFLLGVSILARPFGRALHVFGSGVGSRLSGFQSSPGLLAGRYVHDLTWLATGSKVSILARPFGRALHSGGAGGGGGLDVSILARPFGRALQACFAARRTVALFQSSPGLLAGRYVRPV